MSTGIEPEKETQAELSSSSRDVVILILDFSSTGEDALSRNNLRLVQLIDEKTREINGLRGFSSILRTSIVKAENDEILVMPAIPEDIFNEYDDAKIQEIRDNYPLYPEIHPFLSSDFSQCTFFLEPGISCSSYLLVREIENLQKEIREKYGFSFEFTGLRPIQVYIERLMTADIIKIFPLLIVLISGLYFIAFRKLKLILLSWFIKILITAASLGFCLMLNGEITLLVILVPVFNAGLLSDYLIHIIYHLQNDLRFSTPGEISRYLRIPLSLTALTTLVGFLSLTLFKNSSHNLLAVMICFSIAAVYILSLSWVPSLKPSLFIYRTDNSSKSPKITGKLNRILSIVFLRLFRLRIPVIIILSGLTVLSVFNLPRIDIQPYPLQQLPGTSTVIKAEKYLNDNFTGTVPFTIEINTGESGSLLTYKNMHLIDSIQDILGNDPGTGFQHSILTVIKRIHYYFQNSDPDSLVIPGIDDDFMFSSLVEQYLLFYSSSVRPEEYESLIDPDFSIISIQGIMKYRDRQTLKTFRNSLKQMENELPEEWQITLSGPVGELVYRAGILEKNWFYSFGAGSLLIFLTVLIFLKNIKMSLLSLFGSLLILLIITGMIAVSGIKIDEYTIIFFAVTIGITIDYTIHVLNGIKRTAARHKDLKMFVYAVIKSSGTPVFLSFLTSSFAFSSLFLSSFTGAANLAFMLTFAMGLAFFTGVFFLPMLFFSGNKRSLRRKK